MIPFLFHVRTTRLIVSCVPNSIFLMGAYANSDDAVRFLINANIRIELLNCLFILQFDELSA